MSINLYRLQKYIKDVSSIIMMFNKKYVNNMLENMYHVLLTIYFLITNKTKLIFFLFILGHLRLS